MDWTRRDDTLRLREIPLMNPFQGKKKATQRAELWQNIANNLKKSEDPPFTKRSVQDGYTLLCNKQGRKMSYEKAESGISPDLAELGRAYRRSN